MRESTIVVDGVTIGAGTVYPLTDTKGLVDAPGLRQASTPQPRRDGLLGGRGWHGGRQFTLEGIIVNNTSAWGDLRTLRDTLAGALTQPDVVPFDITLEDSTVLRVNARSGPQAFTSVESTSPNVSHWQAQFEALDPRVYGAENSETVGVPEAGDGRAYTRTYPWTYGTPGTTGQVTVVNEGNMATPWVATITGPVTFPQIEHVGLGLVLEFQGTVETGETLVVDSAGRTVLLNGTASRYSWLYRPQWFDLAPGANEVRLGASAGTGSMEFVWRSAWLSG